MSYIDDLKEVFGDKLPPSHIFFATMANKAIPSYQALRKAMGVTSAKENTALYKKLVAEFNAAPVATPLAFSTNLIPTRSATEGTDVTFSVVATGGKTPYTYKWFKGTSEISGATSATFTKTNLVSEDAGAYKVEVTDANSAKITSTVCTLTVTAP